MGLVDLHRRRNRSRRKPPAPGIARDPLLLLGTGFVLGALAPEVFRYLFFPSDGVFLSLLVVAVVAVLACYAGRLLLRRRPDGHDPAPGSEKQLLLAVLDKPAGITPVEAALETSLTVDEAEKLLTHLAERGHLKIESQDGVLLYSLPVGHM